MKNSFNLEVNLSVSPTQSYEWTKTCFVMNKSVIRVSSSVLKGALSHEGKLGLEGTVLLSDTKNAALFRLDKEGNIKLRSFLKFEDELDVCEFACNLKEKDIRAEFDSKKIHYERGLSIEAEMKKYLIDKVKNTKDESLSRYLYYLYFDDIADYSRDKLLSSIEESSIDKNMKVYKFLIES